MQATRHILKTPSGERPLQLISGIRGEGKTTFVEAQIQAARAAGRNVAGVYCPAIFSGGEKTGIRVIDIANGESTVLARWNGGAWRFEENGIQLGRRALKNSAGCDVLIVDEIGPLELEQGGGWANALEILRAGEYAEAWVVVRESLRNNFLEWFHLNLAQSDGEAAVPPVEQSSVGLSNGGLAASRAEKLNPLPFT